MINYSRYLLPLIIVWSFSAKLLAQCDPAAVTKFVPPLNRQLFHDEVNTAQKNILKYDGKDDNKLAISSNEEVNILLTKAATDKIDCIQFRIEKDSLLPAQKKIYYIRKLSTFLRSLIAGWRSGQANPINLPAVVEAFDDCMQLDRNGLSVESYIDKLSYENGSSIIRSMAFEDNPGFKASKDLLIKKYCNLHPDQTFQTLRENPDVPFADSLVRTVARKYPDQLYNYAAANNKFAYLIQKINDDPFIKAVSRMSRSKSGRLYFPFLDNIVSGKTTFEEIDLVREDSISYYKLLVRTKSDYVRRALNKDTAFGYRDLGYMIEKKATDVFVNTINGLHEVDDPTVRFKIIQSLNAQELYYLAVSTDGIIYTSSFVKGVYPLMMSRVNQKGDSLLKLVMFDKYRKFIKMAAGYNTLGNFLNSFSDPGDANALMRAFVGRLEKTNGLEDGVDVADSYASIAETLKPIANEMLNNVRINYERNKEQNDRRGMVMYELLYKLFLSADSSNNIDLSKEFGIPPVYSVSYKALSNDSGRVIMQVFFYGDKDGQNIFEGFKRMFSPAFWKIDNSNSQWITIVSLKGKPVTIFANKPLPEETGDDEKAQRALDEYLEKNKFYPTVTIHRGHSYYANSTIEQMSNASKIVFLGSCGGYHLIHDILKTAPDAHIIASKQIGKTAINRPFFEQLMETVRTGKNIDWIPFWQELEKKVRVEGFEDYIPPYKNLGALFIKAYKKAMGDEDDDNQ